MNGPTKDWMIHVIVAQRYPPRSITLEGRELTFAEWLGLNEPGQQQATFSQEHPDAAGYRRTLSAKSDAEVRELYLNARSEMSKEEWRLAAEQREKKATWNQAHANADFAYWAAAETWTFDEATALLLGKDPNTVNRKMVEKSARISPFAKQFMDVYRLVERAGRTGTFVRLGGKPGSPRGILTWAKTAGAIEISAGLLDAFEARGMPVEDLRGALVAKDAETAELQAQIEALQGQLAVVTAVAHQQKADHATADPLPHSILQNGSPADIEVWVKNFLSKYADENDKLPTIEVTEKEARKHFLKCGKAAPRQFVRTAHRLACKPWMTKHPELSIRGKRPPLSKLKG